MKTKRYTFAKGFLLIEFLVANLFFMMAVSALTGLYIQSSNMRNNAFKRMRALNFAQKMLHQQSSNQEASKLFTGELQESVLEQEGEEPFVCKRVIVTWQSLEHKELSLKITGRGRKDNET